MGCVMLKFLTNINADTVLSDIIKKKKNGTFSAKNYHLISHKLYNLVIRVLS